MTGTMTTLRVAALMTVFALLWGAESAARAADAPGQLMVESEPAGAVVYVDGRFAGQTPLTLPTVDAGAHRVRVVHDGFLENSRLVTIKSGARAMLQTQLTPAPQQLKIVVVEGEGAVNIIQQKTAVAPVIEVRDRNDQPVSGAAVRFTIQKGKATFNGARTLTLTTDSLGRATAAGLTPTGSGALQIGATATFQGQSAAIAIAQTNVVTAAQAAAVASGAGAASGGGMSNVAVAGIVGGAGAGVAGALVLSKRSDGASGSSDADACRASAVCGFWNVFLGAPGRGLDVSACGVSAPGGFSSQGFNVDLSGAFHERWSTATPAVQVDGTMTPTGVTATLRCLTTPATGTMSATPSGVDYLGTATLSGSTISFRVTRSPQ